MPASGRPERRRVYQNHHLDSSRWDAFRRRPGDIVITTAYKAGTTWMQGIVASLIFGDSPPRPVAELSPWIDLRLPPLEPTLAALEAQTHRRFVKTHLPLDGLPYDPEARYVYVGRHGPDVFMSLWNHFTGYTQETRDRMNLTPGRVGPEMPLPPDEPRALWARWATEGWFDWESDGWPYWSLLHHVRTWWEWRHLPNVLFVHFNDLLADLSGEMRRIADFLAIEVPAGEWDARVELATFASMKQRAESVVPSSGAGFEGGAQRFLFKGTNGRYRDVLTEADLRLWQENVTRQLAPGCAHWLEHGGEV